MISLVDWALQFSQEYVGRWPSYNFFVSVNEVAGKADEAINALINNDLLKSCTIQGETSEWMSFTDGLHGGRTTGTIHAKGEFDQNFYFLNLSIF